MKLVKMTLAIATLLLFTGAAQATSLVEIEGFADCYGWQFDGTVQFGSAVSEVTISFVVDLTQDGSVVDSASGFVPGLGPTLPGGLSHSMQPGPGTRISAACTWSAAS